MNEFERKLSEQAFRMPPPEWREEILGSATRIVVPPAWTWRDWFWPSPHAWGALAALWIVFAILSQREPADAVPLPAQGAISADERGTPPVTLLSFHDPREINHVLNYSH